MLLSEFLNRRSIFIKFRLVRGLMENQTVT